MSMRWPRLFAAAGLALAAASPAWASAPPAAPSCPILPADNVWHADISGLPVHGRSAAWLNSTNAGSSRLHPDFGSSGDPSVLYELYAANWNGGHPTAGSGAVFNLRSNALRPATWTSADAAGLPILPGLLRQDEVQSGHVDHAVRFTAQRTDKSFVWPA